MNKITQFLAIALFSIFAVAFKTTATSDYFLKIEAIKGTSKDADFGGWIPAKRVSVSEKSIRLFREPDKSSNKIAGFYMGPVQSTPAVFVARSKGSSEVQSLKITLTNWKMSDFMAQGLEEEIELKFEKLEAVATIAGVEKVIPKEELKAFFEKNFK